MLFVGGPIPRRPVKSGVGPWAPKKLTVVHFPMRGLRCVVALATGTAWAHEAHGDHYLDLAAMMESGASVGSDVTAAPAATPDTSGDVDIFAQMAGATVAPEEQQAVDDESDLSTVFFEASTPPALPFRCILLSMLRSGSGCPSLASNNLVNSS